MEGHGRLYVSDEAGLDPSISSSSGRRFESGFLRMPADRYRADQPSVVRRSPCEWSQARRGKLDFFKKKCEGGAPRRRADVWARVIKSIESTAGQ